MGEEKQFGLVSTTEKRSVHPSYFGRRGETREDLVRGQRNARRAPGCGGRCSIRHNSGESSHGRKTLARIGDDRRAEALLLAASGRSRSGRSLSGQPIRSRRVFARDGGQGNFIEYTTAENGIM